MNTDMSDLIETYMEVVKARAALYLVSNRFDAINDDTPLNSEDSEEIYKVYQALDRIESEWMESLTDSAPAKGDYTATQKLSTNLRKLVKAYWLLNTAKDFGVEIPDNEQ